MKEKLENLTKGQLISIVRNIQKELKKGKKLEELNVTRIKDEYYFEYYWYDAKLGEQDE